MVWPARARCAAAFGLIGHGAASQIGAGIAQSLQEARACGLFSEYRVRGFCRVQRNVVTPGQRACGGVVVHEGFLDRAFSFFAHWSRWRRPRSGAAGFAVRFIVPRRQQGPDAFANDQRLAEEATRARRGSNVAGPQRSSHVVRAQVGAQRTCPEPSKRQATDARR